MPELSSSTYEFSRQTSRRNHQKQPQLENVIINMRVTANSVQGHRKYMEDCYKIRFQRESSLQQQQNHNKTISDQQQLAQSDILFSYFGIFDGHGGKEASQNCKEKLYWKIIELDDFWSDDDSKVLNAIRNGFVKCHMDMWKELRMFSSFFY
jgi:protein phosphatase 1D